MRYLLIAVVLWGALCRSGLPDDLTTLSGTTYHNFTVVKAENGFLTINYVDGSANIKADALPDNLRQQYGLVAPVSTQAPAQPPVHFDELVLNDGTPYLDVTVVKVAPDSLTVMHRDGGAKIPIEKLPSYICKLYGLTSEQAQQYRASIKLQDEKRQQEVANSVAVSTNTDSPTVVPEYSAPPDYGSTGGGVYVHGYYRKNGTYVNGYYRSR